MKDLALYYKPECPFCQKVLAFMEDNGIEIELRNIHEGDNEKDLEDLGGKAQVPGLLKDGKIMYESDDIIAFLKENFA